jgi:hypothetical protein
MVEVVLRRSHVWLFIGVLQEICCEVMRKVGVAGLHRDPEMCEPNKNPPRH